MTVMAAQEDTNGTLFGDPTPEEIKIAEENKPKRTKTPKEPKAPREPRIKVTWFKHIGSVIGKSMGDLFESINEDDV